ncbi:hypothetical protein [Nocardia beijingensis]|uniref:DMATS type aromatic prenyltransferase n=1 Tax=Nocardia beijingensis TaxID=95162 RepID=A0ABW7WGG4_9NOCA
MVTSTAAGEFLTDLAERLMPDHDPALIRAMMERACGGQLNHRAPDGRRASRLTATGIPLEASVSGGRGEFTPAIRYVTETATQETEFGPRLAAQLATIRDLAAWLPNGDAAVADLLQSFITTLYPEPARIPARYRFATWTGVVHHAAAPHHAARLKVYGDPLIVPGALDRLCREWPGFTGLASIPEGEKLIKPVGAAIEVDAHGEVNHKIYLKARPNDVAGPMKLVRYFGDAAWKALSELIDCGADAAELHQDDLFICRARGTGDPVFSLYLLTKRRNDLTALVRELASRHHGTTDAVDALSSAAESVGATWRYSGIGLGFSAEHGIDKLNVYGTPTWSAP